MTDPLIIHGPEQSLLDPTLPDGGLPPAVGVQSFQVFRASKDVPERTDGRGWTYHHHVDMACWKDRLYVAWNCCERDEDVWPSRELYSTSMDGASWSDPRELFPQGVSTALRMYFFHASNGRILAIAGLRPDTSDTSEDAKRGLVVREIRADHSLGDVYTLQRHGEFLAGRMFDQSGDSGFVAACQQLLADNVFLEQQDRGRLLGERRMKWHDARAWSSRAVPGDNQKWVAGKAYSFFRRADGVLVGISKMGWTTLSSDEGRTWSQPVVPRSLITGKAKVWAQRTRDGRYALVYNPSQRNRFPLAILTSDDGINFADCRIVQGELPIQRYAGLHRSIGPQYVRGISHWADDGSRAPEQAMWLVYSMNKEDIWVSRVPLPVRADETQDVEDDFAKFTLGPLIDGWNSYCPKWADVRVIDGALRIHCTDPFDDASATRVFPELRSVDISMDVRIDHSSLTKFEIAVHEKYGSNIPSRVLLGADEVAKWQTIKLTARNTDPMNRISIRTSPQRSIGGAHPVAPGSDRPQPTRGLSIRRLKISRA
jgi:hypothetical protein